MDKITRAYHMPDGLQFRAVEADDSDGVFEGYAVVWDVVDSHGTRFRKGSFKKTLDERGDKIKILNQHNIEEPIGKPLEMHEDATGLFVRGQLTEGVQKADEMRKLIGDDVIDSLSIGFSTIKDKQAGQYRDITEVKLYEFSPVTFPSNEQAKIIDFRSEDFTEPDNDPPEARTEEPKPDAKDTDDVLPVFDKRDVDFDESLKGEELYAQQDALWWALRLTLSDIWWESEGADDAVMLFDTALAKFHNRYLTWAKEFMEFYWEERHAIMATEDLAGIVNAQIRKMGKTIETLAIDTSLTAKELRTLSTGNLLPIESRGKLAELPQEIKDAHRAKRRSIIENLCNEVRSGGINKAESMRFAALLNVALNQSIETEERAEVDVDSLSVALDEINKTITIDE